MATTNTTTMDMCAGYERYNAAGDQTEYVVNHILAPIGICMCALVYTLCLMACLKKAKKGELAFVYQCLYCGSEGLLAASEAIFVLTRYFWAGMYKSSIQWFTSCHACMWYAAHLATAACDFCVTLTWMFAICMAADRVFALWKPFEYRSIDQKKHQILAVTISVFVSLFVSAYDWFTLEVQEGDGGAYKVVTNLDFVYGASGAIYTAMTTTIRSVIGICLFACNVATVLCYRAYRKKQSSLFTSRDKKEVRKKESEKALVIMCACRSAFNILDIMRALISYVLCYLEPRLFACGEIAILVGYVTRWFLKLGDFGFMLVISKRFRAMLTSVVCRKRNVVGFTTHA